MKNIQIVRYDEEILPITEVEQLPYYEKLLEIREVLESLTKFPKNYCSFATRVVKLATELEETAGEYTPKLMIDGKNGYRDSRFHAFNYDPKKGLYIDITQDQFLNDLPGIVVIPSTTKVLTETEQNKRILKNDDTFLGIEKILLALQVREVLRGR